MKSKVFKFRRVWPVVILLLAICSIVAALGGTSTAWITLSLLTLGLTGIMLKFGEMELKRTEASATGLAESEERFRNLVDNSPFAAYIKDAQGSFRWMNKTFLKDSPGMARGGGGAASAMNLDEDDLAVLRGETRETLVEHPRTDGGEARLWLTLRFPVVVGGETLIGCSALEVTEQRDAERRLEAYTRELERSNRELHDFASVAAHDLQEPLRKIRAFGDLLEAEHDGALGPDARDYVARMQSSAMRMQALIEDLLAFSRVNSRAAAMTEVDLGQKLAEVLSDLELALAQSGMSVESEALPVIEADGTQVRQLFQNLVANAIKFRRKDIRPLLRIGCTLQGDFAEIEFKDNGIGFERRYADKIFTIFQRLHGRDEYEGNGVGLAVCRKIAERHGGSIRADSEPGLGSAFRVRLPLRQAKRKAGS